MKLALISDIHANLEALEAVLADVARAGADRVACLGDIVGYGSDPCACLDRVRDLGAVAIVQGNHDAYVADDRDVLGFNPLAIEATRWTRRQLGDERRAWLASLPFEASISPDVVLVHASRPDPEAWSYVRFSDDAAETLQQQTETLCCYGHTHTPIAFALVSGEVRELDRSEYDLASGDRWLINVGSVGQPRDGDWRAAWSMLDTAEWTLTRHRVEYDVETCMRKIIDAGLPERLATRLKLGR